MIEKIYQFYIQNPVVTTDSRNVPGGAIFFALRGDNFNGNLFAKSALDAGASVVVVDDPAYCVDGCILVDNSLKALQDLANYHRHKLNAKVIGITGSNGKTTTKELLFAVLATKYNVYATKGNLNNHIGVPLTLLSVGPETDIAIVEMGANHPGDIKELVGIAEPDYGLITNIGRAHLGGFGSFEGVIAAKAELYEYIVLSGDKVFYNRHNDLLSELVMRFNLQGKSIPYDTFFQDVEVVRGSNSYFLRLRVIIDGSSIEIQTSLIGDYNAENVLAAITVGRFFGVDMNDIKAAIQAYRPTNNRSQCVSTTKNTVIMDAYNANPSSMEVALRNFAKLDSPNKRVILGEMFELGQYSMEEHRRVVELLRELDFTNVILVGKGFESVCDNFLYFSSSDECLLHLKDSPMAGSTVLLKGSRGVQLEKLTDVLLYDNC